MRLVAQLPPVLAAIRAYDVETSRRCTELADYKLFRALPGADDPFAPRLMVAFGEDRSRFSTAQGVQRYAGMGR